MLKKNSKIFLAGHNGMVGSAILRLLKKKRVSKYFNKIEKTIRLNESKKNL